MSSRTRIIENSKKPAIGGGRTQRVSPLALGIEEEGPRRERVERLACVVGSRLPGPRRGCEREGLHGEERDEAGLPLGEEEGEDPVEEVRRGRTLWEAVQPLDEVPVPGARRGVGHGSILPKKEPPIGAAWRRGWSVRLPLLMQGACQPLRVPFRPVSGPIRSERGGGGGAPAARG